MRVLFITGFYPPYIIGGWEQLVEEINRCLQMRGHETKVLTSTYGSNKQYQQEEINRILSLESDLFHYKPLEFLFHNRRLRENLKRTKNIIKTYNPEIIFIHSMWNLSKGIAWTAEQLKPGRVVYYIADHWPYASDPHIAYWQDPAHKPIFGKLKKLLAPIALTAIEREQKDFSLKFQKVLCVSESIKGDLIRFAGIAPECVQVVYNGVDTSIFHPEQRPFKGLPMLYAGSLVWHKGVHTAVEAMAILARKYTPDQISLSIVGSGHPDYETHLKRLVAKDGLEDFVVFKGRIPREEMPALLREYAVLIFPSTWKEPLARITQEAMASGLVVVGTITGGTKELLIEDKTGLTFPPDDPLALANQIEHLLSNTDLYGRLASNARNFVVRKFNINRMIDEVELYLELASQSLEQ